MKLGNPNWAASLRRARKGGVALCEAVSANAEEFALDLAAVVADMRAARHSGRTNLMWDQNEASWEVEGVYCKRFDRSARNVGLESACLALDGKMHFAGR